MKEKPLDEIHLNGKDMPEFAPEPVKGPRITPIERTVPMEEARRNSGKHASSAAGKDFSHATSEEIRADIDRTRDHMDDRLAQLGVKMRPTLKTPWVRMALAGLGLAALGLGGLMTYRILRLRGGMPVGHVKPQHASQRG